MSEKTNRELEAKIALNPEDIEAYVVYADWLTGQGDPRGELIALMHGGADEDQVDAFVREHREPLLGPMAGWVLDEDEPPLSVTWRLGFIDSARFALNYDQLDSNEFPPAQMLAALLEHPSGRVLRALTFGVVQGDGENSYGDVIDELAGHQPQVTLRSLHLGDFEFPDDTEMSWSETGDCGRLWSVLPNLETVILQSGNVELGDIVLPRAKSFTVKSGGLTSAAIQSICRAKWPALQRLEVWFGDRNYGAEGSIDQITPILGGSGLGALKHLGLMNAEFTDDLCSVLPTAKILPQLESLDLSLGTLSDAGARLLGTHRVQFAHLTRLNVEHNWLTEKGEEILRGLCREVHFGEQQSARGSDRRYVMVGE